MNTKSQMFEEWLGQKFFPDMAQFGLRR